jgi:hypothetical protein
LFTGERGAVDCPGLIYVRTIILARALR